MEISYSELRERDVINISDGRSLGRVCDLVMTYPEGIVCGIVVPGRKRGFPWFFPCRNEIFIDFEQIRQIGKDVIIVDLHMTEKLRPSKDCHRIRPPGGSGREENKSPRIDTHDYE